MTSLNELLKKKSCELRHVSTRVTLPNGQVFDEVDGQRAATQCAVKEGFVVDLKPDLQIGRVLDRLYISSQYVAADHCNAGVSRSVSVVVAYLMSHHSMTYEAALNAVRQIRPAAKPNDGFVKQLQNYQQQFISTLAIHLLDNNVT